jgi:adenylate cyclase
MGAMSVDFEAEGLLDGTEGKAREARLDLLRELHDDGVSLDDLRKAVAEDRLALLPVELVLSGEGPRYTREEVAKESGVETELLRRQWRALGMPEPQPGDAAFSEDDIEAAKRVKDILDLGVPEDELLEISRLLGITMSQFAAANRNMAGRVFSGPDDTEKEIGLRYAALQEHFAPLLAPVMGHVLKLHMREQIRNDAFAGALGEMDDAPEMAVCFADLVDFTKLGERLEPTELGAVTSKLGELASDVARGPVRIVKLIGDAVMLVSTRPEELLRAAIALVEASEAEEEGFPLLRAGVAFGPTVTRGGDFYGRSVNLASRITGVARPGSVLADEALKEKVGEEDFSWSFAGERKLKGVSSGVKLFRARIAQAETDTPT